MKALPPPRPKLKAFYSLSDLGRLMGQSRAQAEYFVQANRNPTHQYSARGKVWVTLSEIAKAFPDLFDSIALLTSMDREAKRAESRGATGKVEGLDQPPSTGSVTKGPHGTYRARINDGPQGYRHTIDLGHYRSEAEGWQAIADYRARRMT